MEQFPDRWTVVGIDPAPAKDSVLYDGDKFDKLPAQDLQHCLMELAAGKSPVLVVWDAPLAGLPLPNESAPSHHAGNYYTRPIEAFFTGDAPPSGIAPPPPGISVVGFAGLPHWAISQAVLGHPSDHLSCNELDSPWRVIHERPTDDGKWVVESHPALALWLLLRESYEDEWESWRYKGRKPNEDGSTPAVRRRHIVAALGRALTDEGTTDHLEEVTNADRLDALVSYLLGCALVDRPQPRDWDVDVVGRSATGSFALPRSKCLLKSFERFLDRIGT